MNVLLLAPEFPPAGGIGTRSYQSALNLVRLGHRVTVLTSRSQELHRSWQYPGMEVLNIGWPTTLPGVVGFVATVVAFFIRGLALVATRRIDACYATIAHVGFSALMISWLTGKPYLLAVHGMDIAEPSWAGKIWLPLVAKNARAVTILAERQRDSLRALGVPDARVYLVPEGADLESFHPVPADLGVLDRYGLAGKKVLLTVGRLVRRKGHDMVIRALAEAVKAVPEVVYLVVGTGPEEPVLRRLVDELGLADRVRFAGYAAAEQLLGFFSVADVFIMASREIGGDIEGFGIVFLEAGACGKPVIGGKSGGIADAVADGVSGLLVDPEDPAAIAEAVVRLLTDSALAERLGRQGRERVLGGFSFEATAPVIREMLAAVVPSGDKDTG